jgi:hypothetical protein
MLVHFIGGPAHGRSESIQNPQPTYRMAELRKTAIYKAFDVEDAFPPAAVTDWDEYEYRVTRRTARYAIAEWEAPPADVRFEVKVEVDAFDQALSETLRRLFLERAKEKNGVRCLGVSLTNGVEADLQLLVRVEGPDDAVAIQLAAEKVQQYIDAELHVLRNYVRQVAAVTA